MSVLASSISYTVQVWQEGEHYIAHAMPIDVMSCGATREEAYRMVDEAVTVLLRRLSETGTLQAVLEEAGYALQNGEWVSPTWIGMEVHATAAGF